MRRDNPGEVPDDGPSQGFTDTGDPETECDEVVRGRPYVGRGQGETRLMAAKGYAIGRRHLALLRIIRALNATVTTGIEIPARAEQVQGPGEAPASVIVSEHGIDERPDL